MKGGQLQEGDSGPALCPGAVRKEAWRDLAQGTLPPGSMGTLGLGTENELGASFSGGAQKVRKVG